MFSHTLSVICVLYYQATVYLCLLPYVGQSAGTALDVKAWQGVLYSLLTKAPCQAFTSKTRSMRVCPAQGVYLGLCFICERNIIGKRCVSVKGQVLAATPYIYRVSLIGSVEMNCTPKVRYKTFGVQFINRTKVSNN